VVEVVVAVEVFVVVEVGVVMEVKVVVMVIEQGGDAVSLVVEKVVKGVMMKVRYFLPLLRGFDEKPWLVVKEKVEIFSGDGVFE
jgi:hypothetical protein